MKYLKVPLKFIQERSREFIQELSLIANTKKPFKISNYLFYAIKDNCNLNKIEQLKVKYKINIEVVDEFDLETLRKSLKSERKKLPSFDIIGDIAIIASNYGVDEGKEILNLNKHVKRVYKEVGRHESPFRIQPLKLLLGKDEPITIHKENNTLLKMNVKTVYFSPRLSTERRRIYESIKKNERVMVLFSGVGPYIYEITKNSKVKFVYGIELNPEAHKYSLENRFLNSASNSLPLLGDVRLIMPNLPHYIYGKIIKSNHISELNALNKRFSEKLDFNYINTSEITSISENLKDFPNLVLLDYQHYEQNNFDTLMLLLKDDLQKIKDIGISKYLHLFLKLDLNVNHIINDSNFLKKTNHFLKTLKNNNINLLLNLNLKNNRSHQENTSFSFEGTSYNHFNSYLKEYLKIIKDVLDKLKLSPFVYLDLDNVIESIFSLFCLKMDYWKSKSESDLNKIHHMFTELFSFVKELFLQLYQNVNNRIVKKSGFNVFTNPLKILNYIAELVSKCNINGISQQSFLKFLNSLFLEYLGAFNQDFINLHFIFDELKIQEDMIFDFEVLKKLFIYGNFGFLCDKVELKLINAINNFHYEWFDRILMPLPLGADNFLEFAIPYLKSHGILHLYDFVDESEFPQITIKKFENVTKKFNIRYKVLNSVKTAEISPKKYRVCLDIQIFRED